MTRPRDAIRQLFWVSSDRTANQPPQPAIFPDQLAPVVRIARDGDRVMEMMRWGFPPPLNLGTRPVTNVRNTASPYWRAWLKPEFRCLVPATSFAEYTDSQPKVPHWFALGADRPPFAFLTTEANTVVRPVRAKAMPVILTDETWDTWLGADTAAALKLQQPLSAERLAIVATGQRQDAAV